jgi:hypothetical protein
LQKQKLKINIKLLKYIQKNKNIFFEYVFDIDLNNISCNIDDIKNLKNKIKILSKKIEKNSFFKKERKLEDEHKMTILEGKAKKLFKEENKIFNEETKKKENKYKEQLSELKNKIYILNRKQSLLAANNAILELAEEYNSYKCFYLPYNTDFRGRIYPMDT